MSKRQLVFHPYIMRMTNGLVIVLLATLVAVFSGCASAPQQTLATQQAETLQTLGFKKIEDGWKLILPDRVLFDFNKKELKPEQRRSISKVSDELKSVQINRVRIEGHTDNIGAPDYNQQLSLQRAHSVAGIFVANGFAAENVEEKGNGETQPVADNATEEGRAENRRVEIIVLSTVLSAK